MSAHADALDCREKSGERRAAQYFIGTDYKLCAGLEEAGGLGEARSPARLGITAVTAGLLPRRRIMHNNLLHTNAQILIEAALSDRPKQY